jgi:hypothetical protein
LFEYLQAQLETETERLSGLLEHADMSQKKTIVEITLLAGKRLAHLLDGVKSGLVDEQSKKVASAFSQKNVSFIKNQLAIT